MEKLDHETSEALEGTWDSDGRANFDKDAFGSVDVDLQLAGLVDRRVEEGKETLQGSQHVLCPRVRLVLPDE